VEVARCGEGLADDARADELTVLSDELAVRLVLEEHLSDPGDDEWIDEAEDNGGDDCVENGGDEIARRMVSFLQARWMAVMMMSMSLMPRNGAMRRRRHRG